MSAGELEHEWAGTPGRLIRERYRRAAEVSRVHGKLSCLLINDIDAGLGHFDNTQVGGPGGLPACGCAAEWVGVHPAWRLAPEPA
jgi:hypothetical protein